MSPEFTTQPPSFLKLLAHDLRWNILKALTVSDYRVQELVEQLRQPMNLVSYHLKKLRDEAVVTMRRSDADGRDVYYSLDLAVVHHLFVASVLALHPSLAATPVHSTDTFPTSLRVLFVCTHNSARSQMAEGLLRHLAGNRVEVFSAGSNPTYVHPDAVVTMDQLGIDIRTQQAKPVEDFEGKQFDYVITVCDKARETCPVFSGTGQLIHWSFPDPVAVTSDEDRAARFKEIAAQLQSRIQYFLHAVSELKE
jgi:protein-tyrosine-phosphatase/DNA-binding transcriptional ArsR family regulator